MLKSNLGSRMECAFPGATVWECWNCIIIWAVENLVMDPRYFLTSQFWIWGGKTIVCGVVVPFCPCVELAIRLCNQITSSQIKDKSWFCIRPERHCANSCTATEKLLHGTYYTLQQCMPWQWLVQLPTMHFLLCISVSFPTTSCGIRLVWKSRPQTPNWTPECTKDLHRHASVQV